jgi:hypothetical protein
MYGAAEDNFSSIFVATINLAAPASNINIGCTVLTIEVHFCLAALAVVRVRVAEAVLWQWHCSGIAAVVLQWHCFSCIAVMLQGHATAEGWWHFCGIVPAALQRCCRGMALLRGGGVTVVLWGSHCSGIAMAMLQ